MAKVYMGRAGKRRKLTAFQVYKITCSANGKAYIGITTQGYVKRFGQHIRRAILGSPGRDGDTHLARAIRKHGAAAFSVAHIASARSFEDLLLVEVTLISQHMTLWPLGYNRTLGGEGALGLSCPCPPERREQIRASLTGRKLPAEHKEAIRAGVMAIMTEERKIAVGAFHLGRTRPPTTGRAISAANTGVKKTEAARANISAGKATRSGHLRGTSPTKSGRWRAQISIRSGKSKYLGSFATAEEAHEAWKAAYDQFHSKVEGGPDNHIVV